MNQTVSDAVCITLPPPDPRLHAHAKGNWRAKATATKELRELAHILTPTPSKPWPKATVTYRFWFKDNRRRDVANAIQSLKPAIDGVVDARLINDDCWQCLTVASVVCGIDKDNPRTELEFRRDL